MAAPKAGGMLFRGDLQGEPKPAGRLLGHSQGWSGKELAWQTKQNPASRRAQPALPSRCLREHAGQGRYISRRSHMEETDQRSQICRTNEEAAWR